MGKKDHSIQTEQLLAMAPHNVIPDYLPRPVGRIFQILDMAIPESTAKSWKIQDNPCKFSKLMGTMCGFPGWRVSGSGASKITLSLEPLKGLKTGVALSGTAANKQV